MTPDLWLRVKQIVDEVLDADPTRRKDVLESACAGDSTLRQSAEALLATCERPDTHFKPLVRENAAELVTRLTDVLSIGQRIGPYRVTGVIATGGMGMVYRAVRADDQYEKNVAIKLVRRGLVTADLLRRFRRERQTLANLEHPHIARLLDGGVTEEGLPYFVMEYVDGKPIDEYCDEKHLPIEQRLELFRRVCQAVHYAHQNLVVHCDLKPGNIMVTADGVVKLLDFGVSKLLDAEKGVVSGDPTTTLMRRMTPQYASPEQFRGDTITIATDVYSLGVVLYELLSGHRPYRLKERIQDEMQRIICSVDPEKPSTAIQRVEQIAGRDRTTRTITAETVSRLRKADPDKLRRRLQGDLDTIVLMAMRKEPHRRYASMEQFAEDIHKHAAGFPVVARRDTLAYRSTKFIRRHRMGVAAAILVALTCAGGVGAITWQDGIIRQERDNAQVQARKAELISQFLREMLSCVDPDKSEGRELTMREVLDAAAAEVDKQLADEPEGRAAIHDTIGATYQKLGLLKEAKEHLESSLEIRRQRLEAGRRTADVGGSNIESMAADVAVSENDLADLLKAKGEYVEAERLFRSALETFEALPTRRPANTAATMNNLAGLMYLLGRYEEAEKLFQDSLDRHRELCKPDDPKIATILNNLAVMRVTLGDYKAAEKSYREALTIHRRVLGDNNLETANTVNNLAALLNDMGDLDGAELMYREALDIETRLLGRDHPTLGPTLSNLGLLLHEKAQPEAAVPLLERALEIERKHLGPEHPSIGTTLNNLGLARMAMRQFDEAEAAFRQALEIRMAKLGSEHDSVATYTNNLGMLLKITGRIDEAEKVYRESLDMLRRSLGDEHPVVATNLNNLASLYVAEDRWNEAEPIARQALAMRHKFLPPTHDDLASSAYLLAKCLIGLGRPVEAEPLLRDCLDRKKDVAPKDRWQYATVSMKLGQCLTALGRYGDAEPLLRESIPVIEAKFGAGHDRTKEAAGYLNDLIKQRNSRS